MRHIGIVTGSAPNSGAWRALPGLSTHQAEARHWLCEVHGANGYLIDQFPVQDESADRSSEFRAVFAGTLMGNCGYAQEAAEVTIASGADLIAFGRPFLSNPDLVERFANGWELNPPADIVNEGGGLTQESDRV